MDDELRAIRARLIEARKRAGYTQQAAAEAIGLSRASSLSDLETGRSEIGLRHLINLCALYGIPAISLFSPAEERVNMALTDEQVKTLAVASSRLIKDYPALLLEVRENWARQVSAVCDEVLALRNERDQLRRALQRDAP